MNYSSGFMGLIYSITNWIYKFASVNLLWILINLPLIPFVILLIFSEDFIGGIVFYGLPIVVLLPILFIPNTIALFATVRDLILKRDGFTFKKYLSYMKSFYQKGFLSGVILTIIWLVWGLDFYYFMNESDLFKMVFIILGIILIVYSVNFFCMSVHFHMKTKKILLNTFFITIGSPFLFLAIVFIHFSLFYITFTKFIILIVFFTGAISAYLSFLVFYQFTLKVEKKAKHS